MPQLVTVALYHRDQFSEGNSRRIFGYEAYHWGILITPQESEGNDCHAYEATDASYIDTITMRMVNPTMDWWYRATEAVDPTLSSKHLGRIIIGEIPRDMSAEELFVFFGHVSLPTKNTDPQQSCVTWVADAIQQLQQHNFVPRFDINQFKDWALLYADDRMLGSASTESNVKSYLN